MVLASETLPVSVGLVGRAVQCSIHDAHAVHACVTGWMHDNTSMHEVHLQPCYWFRVQTYIGG